MHAPDNPIRWFAASSNGGKLREYRDLAAGTPIEVALIPNFSSLPAFEETAPTFGENAAGKALHYSRLFPETVIADDSGLVVPALGGRPGVHSARYAGTGASDRDRIEKLLGELRGTRGADRRARFVCVIGLARAGNMIGLFSASCEGEILDSPRGEHGFGYDPVFLLPELGKSYAEISREEKNRFSHRGKAFQKAIELLKQESRIS